MEWVCYRIVQPQQNKLSIRALTLISFRDCVLLKTKLAGKSLIFNSVSCEEERERDDGLSRSPGLL